MGQLRRPSIINLPGVNGFATKYVRLILVLGFCVMIWWFMNNPKIEDDECGLHPYRQLYCFFDEILIITVASRRERVINMIDELQLRDRVTMIDAVLKPKSEGDWQMIKDEDSFQPEVLEQMTAGEIAVSLSQRKSLNRFLDNPNAQAALVFEDDFEPNGDDVMERWSASIPHLENVSAQWDVLFLGRCHDHCELDEHVGGDLYRVYKPVCLHAFGIRREPAKMLIAATKACNGSWCAIDNVMRRLIAGTEAYPAFVAYAISPQLFTQEKKYRVASMVKADENDLQRMAKEGDHWGHAVRKPALKEIVLTECMTRHERVLISKVNYWRDRTGKKPSPKQLGYQRHRKKLFEAEQNPPAQPQPQSKRELIPLHLPLHHKVLIPLHQLPLNESAVVI
eukprot:m.108064 g.108064  ORF g.108064 m.108064 type:complete len:395 (-) comp27842_c1_seq5:55-1239(-)